MNVLADIEAFVSNNPTAGTEAARRERRRISAHLKGVESSEIKALAKQLAGTEGSWRRYFAYEILANHKAAFATLTEDDIQMLGQGMASWGEVDMFACCILGRAWRAGLLRDETVRAWTESSSRWWRRAALVSTIPLNVKAQGGTGDQRRTLDICERLIGDRDDMVVKACHGLCVPSPVLAVMRFKTGLERTDRGSRLELSVRSRTNYGLGLRTLAKSPIGARDARDSP